MTQTQVTAVFDSLWNSIYVDEAGSIDPVELGLLNDKSKLLQWSDNLIEKWVGDVLESSTSGVSIIDLGCGIGQSFRCIVEICERSFSQVKELHYYGVDLINLGNAERVVKTALENTIPDVPSKTTFEQVDMVGFGGSSRRAQLVFALGSLHHTPSVRESLIATYQNVAPGGCYVGWIINKQKPLRSVTDGFFRDYFSRYSSINGCSEELYELANIFEKLGEATVGVDVTVRKDIEVLGLPAGTYNLQSLLYDYVLKCYFRSGDMPEGSTRIVAQLFDWFSPRYYHQTSLEQLNAYVDALEFVERYEVVEKTNGLFFMIKKASA